MKKLIALATIVLLLIPVFTVAAGGAKEKQTAAVVREGTGPSWTWDTSPVTLGLYMHEGWYTKQWNPSLNIRDKALFDATGVNLDISMPTGDAQERLNTMIAGRTLPDIVILGWWFDQVRQMQEAGMLYPLNELIDEYAPDFWDIIPQSMVDWYTAPDGNWYQFPNFFWAGEDLERYAEYGVGFQSNGGMYARKDIMDELGITAEDFTTQDGMVNALRKVKGYTYDGYPVHPVYFGPGAVGEFLGWIGTGFFAIPREDADGNLLDMRVQPKYLELLQFQNRLYREGLMSDENFVDVRQQITERKSRGEVFLFIGNTADYTGSIRDLVMLDPEAQYVPVGPVRARDGAHPWINSSGLAGWQVNIIPRTSERPDRAIRFLQYLYSEEGQNLVNFGIEGVTYEKVNGRIQWTDYYLEQQAADPQGAGQKYGDGGGMWWVNNPVYGRSVEPAPATLHAQLHRAIWDASAPYVLNDLAWNNIGPDGGTDEAAIAAEVGTYWEAQLPQMVMASSPAEVEAIWRDSVAHIRRLGVESVWEVENQKFQRNKERLGLRYAWPPNQERFGR
ncbi:MAG: extracellular solute-binding protein [Spirochaetaceae bacterium]|nr:MAG: extracellular solute-binding protein [Spirochaetaceae bacterium]